MDACPKLPETVRWFSRSFLLIWLIHSVHALTLPVDDAEPQVEPRVVVYEASDPHGKAIVSIEENLKQQVRDNVAANHQKFALATGSMTADAGESGEITNETLKEKHASTEMKRALAAQAGQNIDEERNRHTQKMMELEGKVHERLKEVQKREHEVFAAEHMLERELETGETTLSNVQWHAAKEEQRHGTLTGILGRTEDTLKSKYKSKIPPHPYSFVEGARTHENGSPLVFLSRRHQAR